MERSPNDGYAITHILPICIEWHPVAKWGVHTIKPPGLFRVLFALSRLDFHRQQKKRASSYAGLPGSL